MEITIQHRQHRQVLQFISYRVISLTSCLGRIGCIVNNYFTNRITKMITQHKIKNSLRSLSDIELGVTKQTRGRILRESMSGDVDTQFCVENLIVQKPSRTGICLDKYHQVTFFNIPVHTQTTSKQIVGIRFIHLLVSSLIIATGTFSLPYENRLDAGAVTSVLPCVV